MQDLLQQLEETPDAHGGDSLPSPTGLKQLQFELNTKRDTFQVLKPTIVYSSPLRRALVTSVAAYPHGKVIVDQKFKRERNSTQTQNGKTNDQINHRGKQLQGYL